MKIYFLRHGEAVHATAQMQDGERPLSDLGKRQASAVGRYLARAGSEIELIICSKAVRSQETAEAVRHELGHVAVQSNEFLTSSSDPRDILREIKKWSARNVLLVGHEPHLSKTISLLLWGDARSRVEMGTCSLACVSTADHPKEGGGILQLLLASDQMLKG